MYYSNFFPTCVLHYLIQWRLFIIVLGLEKFIADLYTVFVFFTTDVLDFFLVAIWNQHNKLLKNKNGKKFNARLNLSCIPVCVFQEILKFFAQMLLSIQHVHSKQILHRDLKTQNILLDKKREVVKIGDFGISKVLSSKSKAYTVRTYLYIFCYYWWFGKSFLLILELAYDHF